ncbi:MAG: cytochrome b N-terminal domain-containing protein [Thermodesulfovibrionales bacterium]|nr:cytochrome b N-terminal domain-containing protein [Thermodesulfovibrionales bacterium]
MIIRLFDWIDKKLYFTIRHKQFLYRKIPENIGYSYCLGGMAFTFFILLVTTGLFLTLYYVPSEKEAYRSVVVITEQNIITNMIRNTHKISASLFIITTILHSLRVFIHRAYLPPRELNWMTGVLAMLFSFASGFTGYLLPWDQKAYWATEVGTAMFKSIPVVGNYIVILLRGGEDVSGATLTRFYSAHVLFLPISISFLLWAHFHMVKRLGIAKKL